MLIETGDTNKNNKVSYVSYILVIVFNMQIEIKVYFFLKSQITLVFFFFLLSLNCMSFCKR